MDIDFEQYLMDRYVADGGNDPDDGFYDFCVDLPIENLIMFANDYVKECLRIAKAKGELNG